MFKLPILYDNFLTIYKKPYRTPKEKRMFSKYPMIIYFWIIVFRCLMFLLQMHNYKYKNNLINCNAIDVIYSTNVYKKQFYLI
jgi:hypothetical protein